LLRLVHFVPRLYMLLPFIFSLKNLQCAIR
jgi:hypothetical protein